MISLIMRENSTQQIGPVRTRGALARLVAVNLRELRTERGWSQRDLAARVSLDPGRLSKYESGKRLPPLLTLVHLANVFLVPVDSLVQPWGVVSHDLSARFAKVVSMGAAERELAGGLFDVVIGFRTLATGRWREAGIASGPPADHQERLVQERLKQLESLARVDLLVTAGLLDISIVLLRYLEGSRNEG